MKSARGSGPARRGLPVAVLLCLGGASVVLVGAGRTWTSVALPAGPLADARTVSLTGAELVPGIRALGLVGLAGVVALAATRRAGRVAVGVLLLLTGAGVLAAVLVPDLAEAALRAEPTPGGQARGTAWPAATALGGICLCAAGLLTAARGRSWPGLGERYEAPEPAERAPLPATAPRATTERGLWEALDRGEDPTDILGSPTGPPADREADRT